MKGIGERARHTAMKGWVTQNSKGEKIRRIAGRWWVTGCPKKKPPRALHKQFATDEHEKEDSIKI